MALLDKLKDEQDKKYISFWGLLANIIAVGDKNHLGDESYFTVAEALLRLKLHEKVRYFVHDSSNFNFVQVNESETNEAKLFLNMLLPSCGKKLTPTEVINIQRQFKDYFWLKESVEQVIPSGIVNFTNPIFSSAGEHRLLEVKPSYMSYGSSDDDFIALQQQNQYLQERISELEAKQGYLDPSNKYFSIEMKLCHDTWNELYKNGKESSLAHGQLAANYLKNYPFFTVNTKAINRIKTITNPKMTLASGEANDI